MIMFSPFIEKLIKQFAKFPTIGPRAATRFVFYLLQAPQEEVKQLSKTISELHKTIKICTFCFNLFEPSSHTKDKCLCEICSSAMRDKKVICIVEKIVDLAVIEKTKKYKGLYFVLGENVLNSKQEILERTRIQELIKRIKNPADFHISKANFKEIIIATNPTTEGTATAIYLERILKPLNKKITRLGIGLPLGGELEYADEETLCSSLESRK